MDDDFTEIEDKIRKVEDSRLPQLGETLHA